ncbi:MAG: hypothetical protein ABJE66_11405 [Deltaproteobacteria bacterium]
MRANVASYQANFTVAEIGSECPPTGTTFDAGVGWEFFPRRVFEGFNAELGVVRRSVPNRDQYCEYFDVYDTKTHTVTYAGRALVGWSWTIGKHFFIAVAAGASYGHEAGHETTERLFDSPPITAPVSRWRSSGETYLRFGAAI